jgi:hypothetical protein
MNKKNLIILLISFIMGIGFVLLVENIAIKKTESVKNEQR